MDTKIIAESYLHELQAEVPATRKCLERISADTFKFKPHETSMEMGYLALLVAEIPLWMATMIEDGEIDLATFPHPTTQTNDELMRYFDENVKRAEAALEKLNDGDLEKHFTLKSNGQAYYSSPLRVDLRTTLNHWVHHRGQLTVYMRLNDIAVPALYGPSADDKNFSVPKE
jgi:uncharacterized damage-inducible protein DinB